MNGPRIDVAIYVRTSLNSGFDNDMSPEEQEARCRDELDRRFGRSTYAATVYRDHKCGGQCQTRPAFVRMRRAFEEGRHQKICVWELGRISRRGDLSQLLDEHFRSHGLEEVIACHEPIFMRTATSRLAASVMAAIGAYEFGRLSERLKGTRASGGEES